MFDPMGLDKETEHAAAPENPPGEPIEKRFSHDSPTLWFLLMIVDGVFVVVFGGLVAARFLQHWGAPPPPAAARAQANIKKAKPEAAEPAKAPEPPKPAGEMKAAPAPAPAPPPAAKAPEAPKAPEPIKPPKPSLVSEPPKSHEAPKPQKTAAAKAEEAPKPSAPAAAPVKVRAAPVDFKLHSPNAKKVQLVGAFLVHGGKKDMAGSGGDWTVTVYLTPGTYRYTFLVDGRKVLDPENPKIDRGASVLGVLPVP